MNFLSHTLPSSRDITTALASRGLEKTARQLRKLIPGELVVNLLVRAAVTGLLPALDENGTEVSVATPVDMKTRMDTLRYLANKRIPELKQGEEEERVFNLDDLPKTAKEAQELTPEELDRAIEATFQVHQETSCPSPQSTTTSPVATGGSSSPGTPADPRPQSDPFPFLEKQRLKRTGDSVSTNPSTSNG